MADEMRHWPSWKYHPDHPEGRLFQSPEEVPDGWFDSPADLPGAGDPDILDTLPEDEAEAKLVLEAWARQHLGIDLDRRRSLSALRRQVREALAGGDGA